MATANPSRPGGPLRWINRLVREGLQNSCMPYSSNDKLPSAVRHHLPPAAQSVYREAFNHAWKTYARDTRQEEIAHRVAWAAVKRQFHKTEGGDWEADGR